MKRFLTVALAFVLPAVIGTSAAGEVKTVWKLNTGEAATPRFNFEGAPAPSATDAAVNAKFTVIAGRLDGNGAPTAALHDGRLARHEDEPAACLFFAAGTRGGRLVIDLGQVTAVKQVNTYSWHRSSRGPQVYELFGADGAAEGFLAAPAQGDPRKVGWNHIASVDTREKDSPDGGQYAVSTFDPNGGDIGKYRYLLMVIERTQDRDAFGNTFYSEIDVADGKEHKPVAPPAPQPLVITAKTGPYRIDFDLTETPELAEWVKADLQPICEKWYPKIVEMLPSDGYDAPRQVRVTFKKDMRGVAYASRNQITCAGDWFKRNLKGEAVGAVVHELVHVVQQYRFSRGGVRNPGWMVEGLADYIRWFLYEPPSKRPRVNPARAKYTDSYRTTAAFLNYVADKHDKDLIKKFNAAMRQGKYAPQLWIDYTGKSVDDLWAEYVETLEADR